MKLRIGDTGDEGWPMGMRKMAKMGKNGKFWKNRQKWYKNDKKMKEFPISFSKSTHLYFIHHIILEKNEEHDQPKTDPWGRPEITSLYLTNFPQH